MTNEVIDLSRLPPLDIVKQVDHASLLQDTVKKAGLDNPAPSDPGYRVTSENTYREVMVRQDANEQAKGLTLAYSKGTALDHIGVTYYRKPDGRPVERLKNTVKEVQDIASYPMTVSGGISVQSGRYYAVIVGDPTSGIEVPDTESSNWIVESPDGDRAECYSYVRQGDNYVLLWNRLGWPDDVSGIATLTLIQTEIKVLGEELEDDEDYRERLHTAPGGYSVAGPDDAYRFHAQSAHPDIKNVAVTSPAPVEVVLYLLTHTGNGVPSRGLCDLVRTYVEPFRPLTDKLTVEPGTVIEYTVTAELTIKSGPSQEEVAKAAIQRLSDYLSEQHRFEGQVDVSGVHWALRVEGVASVRLIDWQDITASKNEAPFCTSMVVTYV
ncbi:baseplate assembly protein [Vibrio parahaemolyticus]|uniref:baseplate assembly protein n=1 Tax=Vibrio parahaemolyticus TaxID=670 RepID=UPI002360D55C|nr:baseplate J/gp47 family protein [Vibrio parahaemolyticus]